MREKASLNGRAVVRVMGKAQDELPFIFLVACVKGKVDHPAPARDLYTSAWFNKAKAFVEATGKPWYILSAEHGLVDPNTTLRPYDKTLYKMTPTQRRAWGRKVGAQLTDILPPHSRVAVLAGKVYRKPIWNTLKDVALRVYVPMEGLQIGEQLRWLTQAAAKLRRGVPFTKAMGISSCWWKTPDGRVDQSVAAAWRAKVIARIRR